MDFESITNQDRLNFSALLLLSYFPEAKLDSVFGLDPENEEQRYKVQKLLKLYNIGSSSELRVIVHNYQVGDYANASVYRIAEELRDFNEDQFIDFLSEIESPSKLNKYKLIYPQRFYIIDKTLLGYNYSLSSLFIRLAGVMGYMTAEEIHLRHIDLAKKVAKQFDTWTAFHQNILLGHQLFEHSLEAAPSIYPQHNNLWSNLLHIQTSYPEWFKKSV